MSKVWKYKQVYIQNNLVQRYLACLNHNNDRKILPELHSSCRYRMGNKDQLVHECQLRPFANTLFRQYVYPNGYQYKVIL